MSMNMILPSLSSSSSLPAPLQYEASNTGRATHARRPSNPALQRNRKTKRRGIRLGEKKERSFWVNKNKRADRSMSGPSTLTLFPSEEENKAMEVHRAARKAMTRLDTRLESPGPSPDGFLRVSSWENCDRKQEEKVRYCARLLRALYSQLGSII